MKIYNKVNIMGQEIDVLFCESVPDDEDGNFRDDKILINPKCKKSEVARVFIHEFLHAVCERGSISQGIDQKFEETIVDIMAKALTENFHFRWK